MTVDTATRADVETLAVLLDEIEEHYGGPAQGTSPARLERLTALLFGPRPPAFVALARLDREVVGMASYSFLWPAAGDTQSLFLKELYVRVPHRRRGVGDTLMRHLHTVAINCGCSRVEWTTERDNTGARAFYDAHRAEPRPDKVFYRVDVTPSETVEADANTAAAKGE
ncbi:GNAT family N-acetyltransferase (plasmid) [Embleya sp. NBC_00888]|uniref:GNAT family N-acetyltransferase n=1 Tax=Embleya sp. NBC_00888 TaxID=2975960 RepID=UPI002F9095C5|nr:GNAT family N-acetyltransferase [Embleya sp. NBC_00888]